MRRRDNPNEKLAGMRVDMDRKSLDEIKSPLSLSIGVKISESNIDIGIKA